ncbi:tRNA-2-methylthio-N(6)-dimethylallyladenosine synthase [bioreactor metagenome]|uniref:tRNA-2-methylthio-N(6)-dimethylallyladenosine synthase n=1 Tax=bioreactor metagenome TaxID=1076179 RepID=A0A645B5K4_9ZZZZ
MNARDSEKLSGMLTAMGYTETKEENEADFVIYNTCCVRENAENKVYGKLGYLKHLKESNPNLKIALCGCMMQQESVISTIKSKYKFVNIVFGTFNIYKLPELLKTQMDTGETVIDIWEKEKGEVENLPELRKYSFKASVNIMYGCNNFCSYCIVPYVRGRERSREPEDIINEVSKLACSGTKEITLLGQNVNSYGKTLDRPFSFAELLRRINEIEGLERIRFMTSHPKDISDDLILAIKDCDKVCKSIHLPFQSGSSLILKKMNRNYTKEKYLEIIRKLKEAIPEITISTDIIVGFPGETEEDFNETIDVVNKVGFCAAFTFIYSKRTGTPAAVMPDQLPEEVINERFPRLLKTVDYSLHKTNEKQVGKTELILVEGKIKITLKY